jgi:hypothetical protein
MDEIKNGELEEALFSVYTTREAEKIWGLAENTVNKWCNRGKFYENEARKSGKVWLVTRNGMNRLTRKNSKKRKSPYHRQIVRTFSIIN